MSNLFVLELELEVMNSDIMHIKDAGLVHLCIICMLRHLSFPGITTFVVN